MDQKIGKFQQKHDNFGQNPQDNNDYDDFVKFNGEVMQIFDSSNAKE